MLTKTQFEIFKYIYDKEEERFSELINRGKIYLSIITIYLAVFTLNSSSTEIIIRDSFWSNLFAALTGLAFIFALLLTVLSIGIFEYEGLCDLKDELSSYPKNGKEDHEFFEDRLADFAISYERNSGKNELRATFLKYASYLIAFGVFSHLIIFYINLWG